MLPSFLLALREGLEATLVVGLVLGALRQLQRRDCARSVWIGTASAVATSVLAALFLHWVGWSLAGPAEPIFEGITLFVAAGLLTWMIAWMSRHPQHWRADLEAGVRSAVGSPERTGVFALTFVAVAREGLELALFLTAAGVDAKPGQTLGGAVLGLAAAVLLSGLLFATTTRLNLRRFFQVTSVLLLLFAAGLVAKGVHEFNETGWIPALIEPAWDTRGVLSERSFAGAILRALFGYTSTPSLSAVLGYATYLGAVALAFTARSSRARQLRS